VGYVFPGVNPTLIDAALTSNNNNNIEKIPKPTMTIGEIN